MIWEPYHESLEGKKWVEIDYDDLIFHIISLCGYGILRMSTSKGLVD